MTARQQNTISVLFLCAILTFVIVTSLSQQINRNPDWIRQRQKMVAEQIEARGIENQQVLQAMLAVERHRFVPGSYRAYAYADHPLPIGYDQTISQPYIVALMTDLLDIDSSSTVLEIGTGSGYQAAVLAEICKAVYSVEIVPQLGQSARQLLDMLGYENTHIKIGDGYQGWPEQAPFDGIIVTCSPTAIPAPLTVQLAEGGRMVIPVGEKYYQELVLLQKRNGKIRRQRIIPVRFVPMMREDGSSY